MITPKVVPLRPAQIVVSLDDFDGIAAVRILSAEIGRELQMNKGLMLKDIARKANLSKQTVSKIYARETYFPRHLTIIMLFKALGFQAMKITKEKDDGLL